MFTNKIRHIAVAMGLVAVAVVTGASAASYVRHNAPTRVETLPVPSGDLGEVIVYAPHDLGEVIVHAPHDLGEVLVTVHREPPVDGAFLAEVVVTVPREGSVYGHATEAAATLAAVQ
ncbi:MAG TPA: hypothetical protein VMU00_04525 [Steroidobacteraceae bacterium]|nr:hypothetical protein [Steroidobacteraceae bacterium]